MRYVDARPVRSAFQHLVTESLARCDMHRFPAFRGGAGTRRDARQGCKACATYFQAGADKLLLAKAIAEQAALLRALTRWRKAGERGERPTLESVQGPAVIPQGELASLVGSYVPAIRRAGPSMKFLEFLDKHYKHAAGRP